MDSSCVLAYTPLSNYFDLGLAPSLLFYAYIPVATIALAIGTLVFFKERSLRSFFLFLISVFFGISIINEIILWVSTPAYIVFFGWSLVPLLRLLIIISTLQLVYVYINKKITPFAYNLLIFIFSLPVVFLLPTSLNIKYFDLINCEAVSGPLINYVYFLGALTACVFLFLAFKIWFISRLKSQEKMESVLLLIGSGLFLSLLSSFEFLAEHTGDYEINLIGPVGLLVFIIILSYSIVRFKTFSIRLLGAQALVIALLVMVGSFQFVAKSNTTKLVAAATFIFTAITGFLLVKSVQKEVKQREELELLTQELEKANVRLKELDKQKSEFVSIASHQLRSPLTAMRGYASMLVEGSFGKIPEKALEAAKRIEDSAKLMAMSVEDYLNVSRIESGNMKYNLSDFNVQEMTDKLCDDLRPEALKQNLILLFRSNITSRGVVNADVGKTNQIIHNLINNSIKYTPKGTINVFVRDDIKKKRIYIDITDTGIGMSQETQHTLFQKFSRAENANSVNVSGTGLGLYVAFKMAEAMGGTITCKSEGDGKGSTFTFELPLGM